ncbi:hypothetical protein [Dyella sp.]|uniref:outer membrane protein assembly factor BamE domain-containing protein n=1 Tax=Dyella sp. TaxID=1869338 RepID=UPI002FD87E32
MRMKFVMLLTGMLSAIHLAGCSLPSSLKYRSSSEMSRISTGMSQEQVVAILGIPASKTSSSGLECLQFSLAEPSRTYPGSYGVYFDRNQRVAEFDSNICQSIRLDALAKRRNG